MAICGVKLRIHFYVLLAGSCAQPVLITDPKQIETEKFVNACAGNDMATAVAMVRRGVAINAGNFDFGSTCLHYAAYNGNLAMVEFLLKNGADVTVKDKNHRTPLFDAIFVARNYKGPDWDSRVINTLLAYGAGSTINMAAHGGTPLYWACRLHEPEIVNLLLENGADPNYDDNGKFWAYRCVQDRLEGYNEEKKQKAQRIWALMKAKGAKEPT